ncbi:MAG: hypothetical protein JOZ41_08065 [Chloroflexi bacterium]|nr:hypothetical protein [Chloroflexota bacterium]
MDRVLTIGYGLLGLLFSVMLGGMAAVVFSDPVILFLGLFGGLLAFAYFLSWALHPVMVRCATCYPPGRRGAPGSAHLCSRCALRARANPE